MRDENKGTTLLAQIREQYGLRARRRMPKSTPDRDAIKQAVERSKAQAREQFRQFKKSRDSTLL
jgi:hypothetical protein